MDYCCFRIYRTFFERPKMRCFIPDAPWEQRTTRKAIWKKKTGLVFQGYRTSNVETHNNRKQWVCIEERPTVFSVHLPPPFFVAPCRPHGATLRCTSVRLSACGHTPPIPWKHDFGAAQAILSNFVFREKNVWKQLNIYFHFAFFVISGCFIPFWMLSFYFSFLVFLDVSCHFKYFSDSGQFFFTLPKTMFFFPKATKLQARSCSQIKFDQIRSHFGSNSYKKKICLVRK